MVKHCPRCGSTNVEWVLPQTWSKWRCRDCGYEGVLIVEDGEMAEEIKKEWEKKHKA
jgi:transposase-like protein